MNEVCRNCRWWDFYVEREIGVCRRYAPRPSVDGGVVSDGEVHCELPVWPITLETEWCGEWEAIPERTIVPIEEVVLTPKRRKGGK